MREVNGLDPVLNCMTKLNLRTPHASLTMIDRHYGHLARDGREHAIRLLDELSAAQRPRWTLVDATWTPERTAAASRDNGNTD
jgi:hypothetical protein